MSVNKRFLVIFALLFGVMWFAIRTRPSPATAAPPPKPELTIAGVLDKMAALHAGMTEAQVADAFFGLRMNSEIRTGDCRWQARIPVDVRTHIADSVTLLRLPGGDHEACSASVIAELTRRYGKPAVDTNAKQSHMTRLYFGGDKGFTFADDLPGVESGGPMISR